MEITTYQQGIMNEITRSAIYLLFQLKDTYDKDTLKADFEVLQKLVDGHSAVLGLGQHIIAQVKKENPFEIYTPKGKTAELAPETRCDLALWLKNDDEGVLMHQARQLIKVLSQRFTCTDITRSCTYLARKAKGENINHDLSGFVDGTANPKAAKRIKAAIIQTGDRSLIGSSCWALQKWQHDFGWLDKAGKQAKETLIGRSLTDNHEFKNNPPFSHISRTEQESFDPEAFMWRRSMPWVNDRLEGGLMFSAFMTDFYPFKAQLKRMTGEIDGIFDGLFTFSKIEYTTFLWCPPFRKGKLDFALFA